MHVKLSYKAENISLFKYQPEYPEYNDDQDYDTGNICFTLFQGASFLPEMITRAQ